MTTTQPKLTSGTALISGISILVAGAAVLSYFFIDLPLAEYIRSNENAKIRELFDIITAFGDSKWYLFPTVIIFIVLRKKNPLTAYKSLFLFSVVAASGILVNIIKFITGRFRPEMYFIDKKFGFDFWRFGFDFFHTQSDYMSFPSGHAATAMSAAMAFGLLYPAARYPLLFAALLVPASRVILGSHYISDVLIGSILGIFTSIILYRKYFEHRVSAS